MRLYTILFILISSLCNAQVSFHNSLGIGSRKLYGYFNVPDDAITDGTTLTITDGVNPGTLDIEYVDGSFEIVGGKLHVNSQTSGVWGDCYTESAKLFTNYLDTFLQKINKTSVGSLNAFEFGLAFNTLLTTNREMAGGIRFSSGNNLNIAHIAQTFFTDYYYNDVNYEFKIVLGAYNSDGGLTGDKRYGFYILFRETDDPRWVLLAKLYNSYYLPANSVTTNTTLSDTRWVEFSDGANTVSIQNNALYLIDNSSTLGDQTKARTTAYTMGDDFLLRHTLKIIQVNNTSQFDSDGNGTANIGSGDVGDATLSEVGVSFPIVHGDLSIRAQIWFQKAMDYGTSGKIEVWTVVDDAPDFIFNRLYAGTDVPINSTFTFEIEYHLDPGNTYYLCDMRIGGVTLFSNQQVGMNSNYGGNNSISYQVKGTAANPVEVEVHKVEVIPLPNMRYLFSTFQGAGDIDDIEIKSGIVPVTENYSSSSVSGSTTFEHSVNCLIDMYVDTYSITDFMRFAVRYVDVSNYYFVDVTSAGAVTLGVRTGGSNTTLGTSSVNAKNGTRLQLKVIDNTAEVWVDNRLGLKYYFVTNNPTEQTFNFIQIPGDCAIDNIVSEEVADVETEASSGAITYIETQAFPADAGSNASTNIPVPIPTTIATGDLMVLTLSERGGTPTFSVTGVANQTWTLAKTFDNSQAAIYYATYNGSFSGATTIDGTCSTAVCTSGVLQVFRPSTASTWVLDYTPGDVLTPSSLTHIVPPRKVSNSETITLAIWITSASRTFTSLTGSGWAQAGIARYRNTAAGDRTLSFAYKACDTYGSVGPVGQTASGTAAPFSACLVTFKQQ